MVKSSSTTAYCFVSGQSGSERSSTRPLNYALSIRQQPQQAKVCGARERDRRPIDPPPIIQLKLTEPSADTNKDYLQSPYLFMCCNLVHAEDPEGEIIAPAHRALAGTVVSSLNRLKDVDNSDGGFFVFGDISVRMEGRFRFRFTLCELFEGRVFHLMSTVSNILTVHSSKTFPGISESTFLSRSFSDQGVRIRIRKDHHVKPKMPSLMYDSKDRSTEAFHSPPLSCQEEGEFMSDNEFALRDVSLTLKNLKTSAGMDVTMHRRFSPSRSEQHLNGRTDPIERWEWTPPSSPDSYVGYHTTLERIEDDNSSNFCSNPSLTMATSRCHGPFCNSSRCPSFSEGSNALYAPSGRPAQCPSPLCSGKHRSGEPLRHSTGIRDPGYPSHHPYRHRDFSSCRCTCSSCNEQPPSHERGRRYTEGSFPLYHHYRTPSYPMGATQSSSTLPTRRSHQRHASMVLNSHRDRSPIDRCASQTSRAHHGFNAALLNGTSHHTTSGRESYDAGHALAPTTPLVAARGFEILPSLSRHTTLPPTSQPLAPLLGAAQTPASRELWRAQVNLPSILSFSKNALGITDRSAVMAVRSE